MKLPTTMMRTAAAVAVLAAVPLLGMASPASAETVEPTASAETVEAAASAETVEPAASAETVEPAADSCTNNWSLKSREGKANGQWCNHDTKVRGKVHDTKADGRCPFVRGTLDNGGHKDSPWAGGKGKSRSFTLKAPRGTRFVRVNMMYVDC